MNRRYLKILNTLIVGMLFLIFAKGQSSVNATQEISESRFTELKKEIAFEDTRKVIRFKDKKKKVKERNEPSFSFGNLLNGSHLFTLLLYILIGAMFAIILYLVFSNIKIEKNIIEADTEVKEIEDLSELDPDSEIAAALRKGDYRGAIRMHFYKVLKILDSKKHIDWTIEKTNRDFLREIKLSNLKTDFRKLATVFEYVWYGNKPVDQQTYNDLEKSFLQFYNFKEL